MVGPDNKSREITPEQYERLEMDNRNGWAAFEEKIGKRCEQVANEMDKVANEMDKTTLGGVGVKHDQGKAQYRLLPMAQLEGVVRVMEYGVEVYEEGDWKFVPDGGKRYLDAGLRHLAKHTDGHILDDVPDNKGRCSYLPHLDHAIASLIMARYFIFEKGFDGGGVQP